MKKKEEKKKCDCEICKRNKRLQTIMDKLPKEDARFIDDLANTLAHVETDAAWNGADKKILMKHHGVSFEEMRKLRNIYHE